QGGDGLRDRNVTGVQACALPISLGGISVDRSAPDRVVADVVRQIRDGTVFALVVTPDGTRKGHSHWKSGFYRIARETGMPVTLGSVPRTTRNTGHSPNMELPGHG